MRGIFTLQVDIGKLKQRHPKSEFAMFQSSSLLFQLDFYLSNVGDFFRSSILNQTTMAK